MAELLRITPKDNVAVALSAIEKGAALTVDGIELVAASDIPAGHKIALSPIAQGENVVKYGFPIGYAKEDVAAGQHIHTHNLHTNLSGELPARLTFSLASLMSLYRGGVLVDGKLQCKRGEETYTLQDDAAVLEFFANTTDMCPCQQVKEFLSNETFFGPDLCKVPGLIESVTDSLKAIIEKGVRAVMEEKFGA